MTDPHPTDDAPNEILAEVKAHARAAEQAVADAVGSRAKSWPIAKIGIGAAIGSAAVAAAVLFARKRDG